MKKKIIFLVCSLLCMFVFCSCGSQKVKDYNGYTAVDLQMSSTQTAANLQSIPEASFDSYIQYYQQLADEADKDDNSAKISLTAISDWAKYYPMFGQFKDYSGFKIDETGKEITTTLSMDYTKRDCKLIYVYDKYSMDIESINVEPVYSLNEVMGKAVLNTIMSMSIVFIILDLIALIIYGFRIIPYLEKKRNSKTMNETAAKQDVSVQLLAGQDDLSDDEELVAVITAAIAASIGGSTDDFVVRSIKRRV